MAKIVLDPSTTFQTHDGFGYTLAAPVSGVNPLARFAFGAGGDDALYEALHGDTGARIKRVIVYPTWDPMIGDLWSGTQSDSHEDAKGVNILSPNFPNFAVWRRMASEFGVDLKMTIGRGFLPPWAYQPASTFVDLGQKADIARHIVDFLYYTIVREQIPIRCVSVQNEPEHESGPIYATAADLVEMTEALDAELTARQMPVALVGPSTTTLKTAKTWAPALEASAQIAPRLEAVSTHVYTNADPETFDNDTNWGLLVGATTGPIWQTENSTFTSSGPDEDMADALEIADRITRHLSAGECAGWYFMLGVSDTSGDNLIRFVDNGAPNYSTVEPKRLYVFRQFSRHIREGAVRIDVTAPAGLDVVAYLMGDQVTCVVTNGTAGGIASDLPVPHVDAWRTSATEDEVSLGKLSGAHTFAAESVTTITGRLYDYPGNIRDDIDYSAQETMFQDAARSNPVTADGQTVLGMTNLAAVRHLDDAGAGFTYKTGIVNGLSVGRFDGVNDYLDSDNLNESQPFRWYVVYVRVRVGAGNNPLLDAVTSATRVMLADTDLIGLCFAGSAVIETTSPVGATVTLVEYQVDQANSEIWLRGVRDDNDFDPGANNPAGLRVGAIGNATPATIFGQNDHCQLLRVDGQTAYDEVVTRTRLAEKWGVDLDAITSIPDTVTAVAVVLEPTTIVGGIISEPNLVSAVATVLEPTTVVGNVILTVPDTVGALATVLEPTTVVDDQPITTTPDTVVALATVLAPTTITPVTTVPDTVVALAVVLSPTTVVGARATAVRLCETLTSVYRLRETLEKISC